MDRTHNCLFLFMLLLWFCLCYSVPTPGFTTTKIGPKPLWNSTYTDKLRQDLLLNYDKFARPTQHYNKTTVYFGMTLRHIEINDMKSMMTIYAWIRLLWTDEKLRWNSSAYGALKSLNMADHEIWQPDIFLYNSIPSTAVNHYGNTHCIVESDGTVMWVPPAQFSVLCSLDLTYWPFDTQTCKFRFGSWTYHGDEIDIFVYNNDTEARTELLVESTEWKLIKTNAKKNVMIYECCPEPYPDLEYYFTVTRRSPSYKAIIITPAVVIIFLTLLNFWLPPQAGEKILLNGCVAIIICIFLLYFTQKIPAMGTHVPLIVLFYSSSLYIVAFATISSVVVIWFSRTQHHQTLPWIIKQRLTGTFGKLLGLSTYINQTSLVSHRVTAEEMKDHQVTNDFEDLSSGDEHQMIRSTKKQPVQQDWILLAAAIDRICFILYTFLFAILAIVYSV